MAAFSCCKMQNINIHYQSNMQWADCLLVSIVSEATGFYLLEVYLESSQKCQQRNLQSLFSVKLCGNSKIVIVILTQQIHNRKWQTEQQSNTSQVIQSDLSTHCPLVRFIPWDSLILPKKPLVFCCPFYQSIHTLWITLQ